MMMIVQLKGHIIIFLVRLLRKGTQGRSHKKSVQSHKSVDLQYLEIVTQEEV